MVMMLDNDTTTVLDGVRWQRSKDKTATEYEAR
jgi:hypothetical protein